MLNPFLSHCKLLKVTRLQTRIWEVVIECVNIYIFWYYGVEKKGQFYNIFSDCRILYFVCTSLGILGCPKMTKVLKCYTPYAFPGAKFQVLLENGHEIDVG